MKLKNKNKIGEWLYNPHRPYTHSFMCSICGKCISETFVYCPNCGNKMRDKKCRNIQ